jgi:hypothetical protein
MDPIYFCCKSIVHIKPALKVNALPVSVKFVALSERRLPSFMTIEMHVAVLRTGEFMLQTKNVIMFL